MMFFWFPFLLLVPLFIFWAVRPAGCGWRHDAYHHGTYVGTYGQPQGPDALDVARLRLARGEISVAEFEEIKRVLGS